MIEQAIEQRIISKIADALSRAGIADIQIVGQLQSAEELKAVEEADTGGTIVVKASPRSYSTPTIPTCSVGVEIAAVIRADKDYNGLTYLQVTDLLMGVFQRWQRCLDDTHEDFSVAGFECTGFQLDAGQFGFLKSAAGWQYTHGMTILGVVADD